MAEWMVTWNNGYNDFSENFTDKYQAEQFFQERIEKYGYNKPCLYKLVRRFDTWYTDKWKYR